MGYVLRGLVIAVVLAVFAPCALAYSGGDGTVGNPYLIADVNDFMELTTDPNNWDKSFVLTNDIVLDPNNNPAHVFTQAPIAPDTDNVTSGFQGTLFRGIFDGDGHILYNLTITASTQDYVGLFGYAGAVSDLGLENVNIQGRSYVGGLSGAYSGTLTACYATGSVAASGSYSGGIVGQALGTITCCYATSSVAASGSYIGGLVGHNSGSTITLCFSTGNVHGGSTVGGLVGYNYGSLPLIENCYATGEVHGASVVGGLVGANVRGKVTYCYSTGRPTGTSSVGGLCGSKTTGVGYEDTGNYWDTETSQISTSAMGKGKTTAQMKTMQTYLNEGWSFVRGTLTLADWVTTDNDYPKQAWQSYTPVTIPNLKGLTEQQAKDAIDALGLLPGETYSVYDASISAGLTSETYPKSGTVVYAGLTPVHCLLAKESRYAQTNGSTPYPYEIKDLGNLLDVFNTPADWSKYFVLMADINLNGMPFSQSPIGPNSTSYFNGRFDGNGHVIRNLVVKNSEYAGLFGYINMGGQYGGYVGNLGMENVNIRGRYAGGLAGYNRGSIGHCYTTGSVGGSYFVGGLVGENRGSIGDCYSNCSVNGNSAYSLGGLVGYIDGYLKSCYSTGLIGGSGTYMGGLIGQSSGFSITSCFWDTQSSGKSVGVGSGSSTGVTGKTTAQMQMLSTFTSAGWDFDLSWIDGDSADWILVSESIEYPRLDWQLPPVYSGGDGSAGHPYKIANVEDFKDLSNTPCHWRSSFILTADLDLSGISFKASPIAPNRINPIDQNFQGIAFYGDFDGNGYVISNLTIAASTQDYIGFFGSISGQIRNLGLENIDIWGRSNVGGLTGESRQGSIINCYSVGLVRGNTNVGGLVGYNYQSKIANCYSVSSIVKPSGNFTYIGGLVGYNESWGSITNSYSCGLISGTGSSVGGFVGYNSSAGFISNCFWDTEASGQTASAGGTGKTTAEMQNVNTFLSSGWDFADESANGTCNFWQLSQGGGYPILSIHSGEILPEPTGTGTPEDPYQIVDANDLGTIWIRPSASYVLTDDIDLSGIQWNMAIIPAFSGKLDGQGHCITNLSISGIGSLGLFGTVYSSGDIRNVGIVNINIVAASFYSGGLAAENRGNLTDCYSSGAIGGTGYYAGGLVGDNYGGIKNCYTICSVSGNNSLGGLAGGNGGSIMNCYSAGLVSGIGSSVSGLVGSNSESGLVSNCFWDIETSGITTGASGTGKTTAEMKALATFAGWDFVDVWAICEGTNYPRLQWQIPAADWVCPDGVRMEDFEYLAGHWMETTPNADLSEDGVVDIEDLILFCDNWMGE